MADPDTHHEGVNYKTVRRVHVLDVPSEREQFMQFLLGRNATNLDGFLHARLEGWLRNKHIVFKAASTSNFEHELCFHRLQRQESGLQLPELAPISPPRVDSSKGPKPVK